MGEAAVEASNITMPCFCEKLDDRMSADFDIIHCYVVKQTDTHTVNKCYTIANSQRQHKVYYLHRTELLTSSDKK